MGDVGMKRERAILETYGGAHLDVDVLCAAHHGSNTSSDTSFLDAATPQYVVISCGAGNADGHPDGRALARLQGTGAEICRTDLEGDISFSVFENTYTYSKK
jgi:competence protein ComEC